MTGERSDDFMGRVAAIINSTSVSDLLPDRPLRTVANKTILEHIVERLKRIPQVDKICLATTDMECDNNLCQLATNLDIQIYRGSFSDLVLRITNAAKQIGAPYILRVSGNHPLIDTEMASKLIRNHFDGDYDYSFNEHAHGVPFGMGCEVITTKALCDFNANIDLTPNQRFTGPLCFLQNQHLFKTLQLDYKTPRPNYKLCIENNADLHLLEAIFLATPNPTVESVIEFLDENPIIAQNNHFETVKEVGIEKLWFFPKKVQSLEHVAIRQPDITYPISVELSLTNRCNLDCLWCSDSDLRKRLPGDLDFSVFKTLIRDLQQGGTSGIVLEGGGEPLLYDNFNEAVEHTDALGLGCGLITNGTKEIKSEILKKLDWIRVSLDASNEKEFLRFKKAPLFETVLRNVSTYIEHCKVVGVSYVVTRQNISSLEPLVLRLKNKGVRYIQFRVVIDHLDLLPEVDLNYLSRYQTNSLFNIIIDGMEENRITGNSRLPCRAHSLTTVVTADGGVYLCGRLNKYPWMEEMGNLNTQSFRRIWQGDKRKKQADKVLDPDFCNKFCPECRITKFNELMSRLDKITTRRFI